MKDMNDRLTWGTQNCRYTLTNDLYFVFFRLPTITTKLLILCFPSHLKNILRILMKKKTKIDDFFKSHVSNSEVQL